MLWTEIRSWAKKLGYETIKDKEDNKYYWAKLGDNNPDSSGVNKSLSGLSKSLFNHYTNNKWIDHQKEYQEKLNGSSKIS